LVTAILGWLILNIDLSDLCRSVDPQVLFFSMETCRYILWMDAWMETDDLGKRNIGFECAGIELIE